MLLLEAELSYYHQKNSKAVGTKTKINETRFQKFGKINYSISKLTITSVPVLSPFEISLVFTFTSLP